MTRSELAAVARLARRTARRNWQRTTLVVLLVAVPVAVAMGASAVARASVVTPEEQLAAELGRADVAVEMWEPTREVADEIERIVATLAPGSDIHAVRAYSVSPFEVTDVDLSEPLMDGKLFITAGRGPTRTDEILLPQRYFQEIGVAVGDEVSVPLPSRAEPTTYTVVGAGAVIGYSAPVAVVVPQELDRLLAAAPDPRRNGLMIRRQQWLLDGIEDQAAFATAFQERWDEFRQAQLPPPVTPRPPALAMLDDELYRSLDAADIEELAAMADELEEWEVYDAAAARADQSFDMGVSVRTRDGVLTPDYQSGSSRLMTPQVVGTLAAGALLAEVALIAGAAYATGARRRLRELGLLSSNGATIPHLRAAVVGEAAVAGVLGALVGFGLGLVVVTAGQPLIQRFVGRFVPGRTFALSDAIGPMIVGVVAVIIAAWLPARTAARVPTVTALAGRMPLSRPPRWIVPVGLGGAAFGALLFFVSLGSDRSAARAMAVVGVLATIGGVALLSAPIVARLGRHADRLPASLRLVVRDATRQRTRAAAAVSATMVLLLAPVVLATGTLWDMASQRVNGLPGPDNHVVVGGAGETPGAPSEPLTEEELDEVRAILTGAAEAPLEFVVDSEVTLPPLEEHREEAAKMPEGMVSYSESGALAALGTPQLVEVLGHPGVAEAMQSGEVAVLGVEERARRLQVGDQELAAHEYPARVLEWSMPRVLVPPAVATELGLEQAEPDGVLFVAERPLTGEQREALYETLLPVSAGWSQASPAVVRLIVVGVALAVVLLVLGLVVALSATESDHDVRTMVAVGAPPRMRRRFLGLQTAYYALLGAVLAVPLGLALFKVGMTNSANVYHGMFGVFDGSRVPIPWDVVAMVLIGIPVIAGGMIALLMRSAPTVPPRRLG